MTFKTTALIAVLVAACTTITTLAAHAIDLTDMYHVTCEPVVKRHKPQVAQQLQALGFQSACDNQFFKENLPQKLSRFGKAYRSQQCHYDQNFGEYHCKSHQVITQ